MVLRTEYGCILILPVGLTQVVMQSCRIGTGNGLRTEGDGNVLIRAQVVIQLPNQIGARGTGRVIVPGGGSVAEAYGRRAGDVAPTRG